MIKEIDNTEALQMIQKKEVKVVDVRETDEYEHGHLDNSISLPMSEMNDEILNKFSKDGKLLFICLRGSRSSQCAEGFHDRGFKEVYSLDGGLENLNNILDKKINLKWPQ